MIGLVALMDVPNEEAMNAIHYFKSQNIETTMITGDAKLTGEAVGRLVGVDQVYANVLPEEKSAIVDQLKREVGMTGMVGDGINDAPALVNADIGVAMGDGTDIAIDVADVVVMKNDLSKLGYAHRVSKRLNKIVQQNIIFSMLVVATLIILNFLGIAGIIVFRERKVSGLTTAVMMWNVTIIGLVIGMGFLTIAFINLVATLLVLALAHFKRKTPLKRLQLIVKMKEPMIKESRLHEQLQDSLEKGERLVELTLESEQEAVTAKISYVGKEDFWHSNLHHLLKEKGHVQSVSVTETI